MKPNFKSKSQRPIMSLESIKIAVLMGGPGSERQVSLASGAAVLKALRERGLNAEPVDVTSTTIDLPAGTGLAFNVIHGTFGEDGRLQETLEAMGVPYTGAGPAVFVRVAAIVVSIHAALGMLKKPRHC
jgi:D-alanine-D-alanine ligase